MSTFWRFCPLDSSTCSNRACLGEPRDPGRCPKEAPSTATTIDVSKSSVPDYSGKDVGDICLKRGLLYNFTEAGSDIAWFTLD